jgi:hypothetical protein
LLLYIGSGPVSGSVTWLGLLGCVWPTSGDLREPRNPSELEVISQGLFWENQRARRLLATKDKAKMKTWQIYRLRRIRDSWNDG